MGQKKLTPYQGSKRCLGHFYCSDCENVWFSAYSWANKGQECKDCETMIYPHVQRKLQKGKQKRQKPHLQDLCEMCCDLGFSCQSLQRKKAKSSTKA